MVAGEGRLARRDDGEIRVVRVRDVGTLTRPEARDDLARKQPERGCGQPGQTGDLEPIPRAGAVEKPERGRCENEDRYGPVRDDVLNVVSEPAVMAQPAVQQMKERPVRPLTLPTSTLFVRRMELWGGAHVHVCPPLAAFANA
jgi:hypothetical protein